MPGRAKPGAPKSDAKQTVGTRRGNGAGHASKGDGWGGPAKGAGTQYVAGEVQPLQGQGNTAAVAAAREEREAKLTAHLEHLAFNAQREETQVSATVQALNRLAGMPIARSVTATVDDVSQLSDLELAAEIARLRRELGESVAGSGEAEAGKQAGRVPPVH